MWKQPPSCQTIRVRGPESPVSCRGFLQAAGMGTAADTQLWAVGDRAVLTHGLQLPADIFFPAACGDSFHSEVSSRSDLLRLLLIFPPSRGHVLTFKFSAENLGSKSRHLSPPHLWGCFLSPEGTDRGATLCKPQL